MVKLDTIQNIDAIEYMKTLEDNSIDMIFTDPPYGTTQNNWDSLIDLNAFWQQADRITKPNSVIAIFSQMPFSVQLVLSNVKDFRYEWILEKANATGFLNARRMPLKAHENLLIFYKHLPIYHPQMTQGEPYTRGQSGGSSNYGKYQHDAKRNYSGERFPRDVLHLQWRSFCGRTLHPTQKPLSLCEYMIRTYTDEGAIILDPFIGSGTIPLAAKSMNRHYLGSEIDSTYYHTALKRLA